MKKLNVQFVGTIKAVSPLTVTRNAEFAISKTADGRKIDYSTLPRTGTTLDDPAYFPSSSLRGKIRRTAYHHVMRCEQKRLEIPHPFGVDDFYMLVNGMQTRSNVVDTDDADGAEDAILDTKKEAKMMAGTIFHDDLLRTKNPMLSLFGKWMHEGRFKIDNAVPGADDVFVNGSGFRVNDLIRDANELQYLSSSEQDRLKEILDHQIKMIDGSKPVQKQIKEAKKAIVVEKDPDEKKRLSTIIDNLETSISEMKGGVEVIGRPFSGYEAIKPGALMSHRMRLSNGSQLELGFILATLRDLAAEPFVGGHTSQGCGWIAMDYTVKIWEKGEAAPAIIGKIGFNDDGFYADDESGYSVLSDALKAWDTAISEKDSPFDFKQYQITA
jgi:CRISPR/Cas system CSM-associated protein Csm3 (group 7 of RAMP superfamily)